MEKPCGCSLGAGHQSPVAHQGHTGNMAFPPSGSIPGLLSMMSDRISLKDGHHFLLLSHCQLMPVPKRPHLPQLPHAQG